MSLFRSIVFTTVLAGLIASIAISFVQFLSTSQLIVRAEVFERTGDQRVAASQDRKATAAHAHDHEEEGWAAADDVERYAFTLAVNALTAIGDALVLTGLIAWPGSSATWREGLLWGLAGFACVTVAPLPRLPLELPGTAAAPVADGQLWWIGTVAATVVGIGLVVFMRAVWAVALAALLVAGPHLIGAPPATAGKSCPGATDARAPVRSCSGVDQLCVLASAWGAERRNPASVRSLT